MQATRAVTGIRHRPEAESASSRAGWLKVRVSTDELTYVGTVRVDAGRSLLQHVADDARAYLSVWDAASERSPTPQDHVAIHKADIRSVTVLGRDPGCCELAGRTPCR